MTLALRHERDSEGIVSLWVDQPEKPVVILDSWLLGQIESFLDWVDRASEPPAGFILHSTSDRVFIAGADLNEIGGLDDAGLDAYLRRGQELFNRIERLPCPTVAAISGDALGGGLEIALACQYRIAAAPSGRMYQIGLPEAKLGILPGWGGTQRLAAVMEPPSVAIGHMTTGRPFTPIAALRLGLIDAIAPAASLHDRAVELIRTNPAPDRARVIQDRPMNLSATLEWAESLDTRPVRRLPAATRIVDAIRIGLEDGLEAGLDAERRFLIELRNSRESRDMLGAFFARTGAIRKIQKTLKSGAAATERIAILGDSPVAMALRKKLGRKANVEQVTPGVDRIAADVVIEAAGDQRQDQLAALRFLSAAAPDHTVIITTSPVLGIDEIAASVTNPARIIGFVPGRPDGNSACEIICGERTSDSTIGAALNLCKLLGLVPIMQRDGGPSVLTRLFGRIAIDAWNAALTTGDPAAVDRAAVAEGAAVGPLRTLDQIGLESAATLVDRREQLGGASRIYAANGSVDPGFQRLLRGERDDSSSAAPLPGEFFIESLVKAAREILDAGLVDSKETLWLAATFGLGLAPWRSDFLESIEVAARKT